MVQHIVFIIIIIFLQQQYTVYSSQNFNYIFLHLLNTSSVAYAEDSASRSAVAVKSAAAAAATLWSPFCSAATAVASIRSRPFLLAPAATLGARQTPPGSRGLDPSQSSASNILMWLHDGHITLMFLMPCLKEKSFACRVKMASSKLEMIARPNPDCRHAPGQGSSSLLEDTEGRGLIRILCWLAASAWSD